MRLRIARVTAAALLLVACGEDEPAREAPYAFEPYVGTTTEPDVTRDRLCPISAAPDTAPDTTFIDCALEGGSFGPSDVAPKEELVVLTWNVERGLELDGVLAALSTDDRMPRADLLLLNELDRGCSRSGTRNVPREIARALGMNYVFGVEFVELPRPGGSGGVITDTCEHGNAVLSRYPLGNVGQLRHQAQRSWYLAPGEREGKDGEPRLGGRVLVYADLKIGDQVRHAYSLHFESSPEYLDVQVAQAVETAEHARMRRFPAVVAGDTNAPFYWLDLRNGPELAPSDEVTQAFFTRGFVDAHAALPVAERGTRNGLVLDLVLGHGGGFGAPGLCAKELCGALSDHLAVWATWTSR